MYEKTDSPEKTKHGMREYAFLLLYEALLRDISDKDLPEILDEAEELIGCAVPAWTTKTVTQAYAHRDEIAAIIASYSKTRAYKRIAVVNRAILLLTLYELIYTAIPENAAVSEAVLLAHSYSYDEDAAFINGVLGAYVRARKNAPKKPEEDGGDGTNLRD